MANSKYVNIPNGFEEEVKYFDQQPNKGAYLWGLVREDMQKKKEDEKMLVVMKTFLDKFSPSQIESLLNSESDFRDFDKPNKTNTSHNTREISDLTKKRKSSELIQRG